MPRTFCSCVVLWKSNIILSSQVWSWSSGRSAAKPRNDWEFSFHRGTIISCNCFLKPTDVRWQHDNHYGDRTLMRKARKGLKDGKNLGQWNCKRLWRHPFDLMEWRSIGQRNHCYQTIVQGRCLTSKSGQCSQAIIQPHSMSSPQLPRQTTIVVSILSSKTSTPSRLLTSD